MARFSRSPGHAGPVLCRFPRDLSRRLFLGDRPSRARRIRGPRRPQGLDRGPHQRRGLDGAHPRLEEQGPPGRAQGLRIPRNLGPGRLSRRDPGYPAGLRRLSHGPVPRRYELVDATPIERDLAPGPGAPAFPRAVRADKTAAGPRIRRRPPAREAPGPARGARGLVSPLGRPPGGRLRSALRAFLDPPRVVLQRRGPGPHPGPPCRNTRLLPQVSLVGFRPGASRRVHPG